MDQSPLTQQARPEVFEPKIVGLYNAQEVEDEERLEGFWREFFLLKPDTARLRQVLEAISPNFLLQIQHQSQQLLLQAVEQLQIGEAPADEHALDTLTVFFAVVLAKKYAAPSADIIEVLAGLDNVDSVFTELVAALDLAIKDGRSIPFRQKAVRTAVAVVAGGFQTALVSYFIHRDFFPALMKASEPFLLTGLLANYNKFETHNQYRVRFADFVNEEAMSRVVEAIGWTCTVLREKYVAIHDDTPTGWKLTAPLSYVGLGALTKTNGSRPGVEASTLLTLYDFTLANKVFSHHFISAPAIDNKNAAPFSNFLSFSSYLFQHAYRSQRASLYAYLALLTLLIVVEDSILAKLLCDIITPVRLCRQRPPHLPFASTHGRPYTACIIDLLVGGMNHNLRKRLDTNFYIQSLAILSRLLRYLARSRTKLQYHWSELWRSLLSFTRFLNTYPDDLKTLTGAPELVHALADLLVMALTTGESFLPSTAAYDDLFYKLVESGDALIKFRESYFSGINGKASVNTLIGVSQHYQALIDAQRSKKDHLSPREVNKIIKQGYETLAIETTGGDEADAGMQLFREADHKTELKKIARVAVADAAVLVGG
nr:upf0588 membrane protein [Quercus suber]